MSQEDRTALEARIKALRADAARLEHSAKLMRDEANYLAIKLDSREAILHAVCNAWHITVERLRSKERAAHVALAREVVIYLLRTHCPGLSYPAIGVLLNKDHSTCITAYKRIVKRIDEHPPYGTTIARIEAQLDIPCLSVSEEVRAA